MIHSPRLWFIPLLLLCVPFFGCADRNAPVGMNPLPLDGSTLPSADTGIGSVDDCADAARWIYLVANDNSFIRFEPDTKTLTTIGTLNCNVVGASPFSMAVDRSATAWVLYSNGRIYKVNATDASCTETAFRPNQEGLRTFGMGFVSNTVGSADETLFIAGGPDKRANSTLATLDTGTLTVSTVGTGGTVVGSPELTGNGNAELWGFSPNVNPKTVIQIDKATGSSIHTYEVSAIGGKDTGDTAWAFAFWGGRYYMFYKGGNSASTSVWSMEPTSGAVTNELMNIGLIIVGAGVSTCAPVVPV